MRRLLLQYLHKLYDDNEDDDDDMLAVRSAELRVLERVNIALSLAFLSPSLVANTATMITLIAYTSAGNDLSPEQVNDIFSATSATIVAFRISCLRALVSTNLSALVSWLRVKFLFLVRAGLTYLGSVHCFGGASTFFPL